MKLVTYSIALVTILVSACQTDPNLKIDIPKNQSKKLIAQNNDIAPLSIGFRSQSSEYVLPAEMEMDINVDIELSAPATSELTIHYEYTGRPSRDGIVPMQEGELTFLPGQKLKTIGVKAYNTGTMDSSFTTAMLRLSDTSRASISRGAHFLFFTMEKKPGSQNVAPIAIAGPDQMHTDNDGDGQFFVLIDGRNSSDPDGQIVNYRWTHEAENIGNTAQIGVNLPVGTHQVVLTVQDDQGATATDQLTVEIAPYIAPINKLPVAKIAFVKNHNDTDNDGKEDVELSGLESSDEDGQIVSYQWYSGEELIARGGQITLPLPVGSHTISLIVTDNDGATATDQINIEITPFISPPNQAPIAKIVAPKEYNDSDNNGAENVMLSGLQSSDEDGKIVTYQWYSGTNLIALGGQVSLPLPVGSHTIRLTVTDDGGATATDQISVEITPYTPPPNQAPIAKIVGPKEYNDRDNNGAENVTLSGLLSSDEDGQIVTYQWYSGANLIALGGQVSLPMPVGSHTIRLTVTDDGGATATDQISVEITPYTPPPNQAPTSKIFALKEIIDRDNDGVENAFLSGLQSSDRDGEIVSYQWYSGEELIASGGEVTLPLPVGSHTISLTVTDDDGATATDQVMIEIAPYTPPPNQAPTSKIFALKKIIDRDNDGVENVFLSGLQSSDRDGEIVSYHWYRGEELIARGGEVNFPLPVGSHAISLVVTDDGDLTGTDLVTIEVVATTPPVNRPPIAKIVAQNEYIDRDENGVENVALSGLESSDEDGQIITHLWYLGDALMAQGGEVTLPLPLGSHRISLRVTDDKGATSEDEVTISVVAPPIVKPDPLDIIIGFERQNFRFEKSEGQLKIEIDVIPKDRNITAVLSLSRDVARLAREAAALFRFEDGRVLARDGDDYKADTRLSFAGETLYRVSMNVDIPSKKYSAYITDLTANGPRQLVGRDYDFRPEQKTTSALEYLNAKARVGEITIKHILVNGRYITPKELPPVNRPPTARALANGPLVDANLDGQEIITLDGTQSSDVDGEIVTYRWSEGGDLVGDEEVISFTRPVGEYIFGLTVIDDQGASSQDFVKVTISPGRNVGRLTFDKDIKPIMQAHCLNCHLSSGTKIKDLALDIYRDDNYLGGDIFARWRRVLARIEDGSMPPAPMTPFRNSDIATIRRWVEEGLDEGQNTSSCDTLAAAPSRVWRLSPVQYQNTVKDLLDLDALGAQSFVAQGSGTGFKYAAETSIVGKELANQYHLEAARLAKLAVAKLDEYIRGNTEDDVKGFIAQFGLKAFRRPLERSQIDDFYNLYLAGASESHQIGMQLLFEAFLQSGYFLYRFEMGESAPGDGGELSSYELASQLSYLLWDSMPDATLFELASTGQLKNPEILAGQVDRMLAHPKARAPLVSFFKQWLSLDRLHNTQKNAAVVANWDEALKKSLLAETRSFVEHVLWDSTGSLNEMWTANYSFANSHTAFLYAQDIIGSEGPIATDQMQKVELNPSRRAGILTQLGFLAVNANEDISNPVFRGAQLREEIFCHTLPEVPNNIDDVLQVPDDATTTRDLYRAHSDNPQCIGCHRLIDPLGFAFEHYDAAGRYRTSENGFAINAKDVLEGTDIDGDNQDAIDLASKLTQSPQVANCFVKKYFRFATGRLESAGDQCLIDSIKREFNRSQNHIFSLIKALALHPSFKTRKRGNP